MQILFDLCQSLSREEKRLYQMHKRENRTQRIYEAYLKALRYTKALDQDIYQDHFSDVSRAFYSMQKRSLMDDILTVLLEYSNNQHPGYQFNRLYGRAMVLLERRMGEAAAVYSEEAMQSARAYDQPDAAVGAVRIQQQALVLSKQPSLKLYEQLNKLEEELAARTEKEKLLEKTRNLLSLLKLNVDGSSKEEVCRKARQFIRPIQELQLQDDLYDLELERLSCEEIYQELVGEPEVYHQKLAAYHRKHVKEGSDLPKIQQYELTNRLLKSGLKVGDFLMLSGAVYKLNKEIDGLNETIKRAFLPDYLESSSIFYFYENDIPSALNQLSIALQLPHLEHAQHLRFVFYRLSILLAAHLPKQGLEDIRELCQRMPEFQENTLIWLLEVLFHLDLKPDGEDTIFLIERHRNALRKRKEGKHILDIMTNVLQFLEKGKYRERNMQVLPSDWEPILQVDLWLHAKAHGSFYYNRLTANWQDRRKVF